jgi:hypothetical protein
MSKGINEAKDDGMDARTRAPQGFEWLASARAILEHVAAALSAAHGSYYFICGQLSELEGNAETSDDDGEEGADAKTMIEAAEALRPLLAKVLPLLRDVPMPEGVAELAYWGNEEKQRAAQTSSAPLRDRRWLQRKLAEIIPAHRKLAAGLQRLWEVVTGHGTRGREYWEQTAHGEDLGPLARDAWNSAGDLTQTFETCWVALSLAAKLDEIAGVGAAGSIPEAGVRATDGA